MKDYWERELKDGDIVAYVEYKSDRRYKRNKRPLFLSVGRYGNGYIHCFCEEGTMVSIDGLEPRDIVIMRDE